MLRRKVEILNSNPCELPTRSLPTGEDVILALQYAKQHKYIEWKEAEKNVSLEVIKLWNTATIPTNSFQRVLAKVSALNKVFLNILNSPNARKSSENYLQKCSIFRSDALKLFDICSCKCEDLKKCVCNRSDKVNPLEHAFLIDQRTNRKMMIGSVDVHTSEILQRRLNRQNRGSNEASTSRQPMVSSSSAVHLPRKRARPDFSSSFLAQGSSSSSESESELVAGWDRDPQTFNWLSITNVAKTADRYDVSDRATAAIVSAAYLDAGLITSQDKRYVVDRMKVQRARRAHRLMNAEGIGQAVTIHAFFFDGRKDISLKNMNGCLKKIKEEHISILEEPGSLFFSHVSVNEGTSMTIMNSIKDRLMEKNVDLTLIKAIGCDGTNVNVGREHGVIRLFELKIGTPVQWFVCLLHANELPLRVLIKKYIGVTKDPNNFTGPIGGKLKNCMEMPIVEFDKICFEEDLEDFNTALLNTDNKYLIDICGNISTGIVPVNFQNRSPGKMAHSRWTTTANCICRVYIATAKPSTALVILVTYILKVYAPISIGIKRHPACVSGALHIHRVIKLSRFLVSLVPAVTMCEFNKCIHRNGYFAHPENILLAMCNDDREPIRSLAYRRVLDARNAFSDAAVPVVREFKVPMLNYSCTDYVDMIRWQKVSPDQQAPPILRDLLITKENIERLANYKITDPQFEGYSINATGEEKKFDIELRSLPCHSQAVERCVKVVTEASKHVSSESQREGYIIAKLRHRCMMPSFNTKNQFVFDRSDVAIQPKL